MRTRLLLCLVLLAGVAPAADSLYVRLVGRFDFSLAALGVAARRGYVYIGSVDDFRVISVAYPANPIEVGRCSTAVDARGVDVAGDYAFVADLGGDTQPSQLRVISVADPAHPVEVGCCSIPGPAQAVAVSGGYAYVADYNFGLRAISVADPARPVEVGRCATPGHAVHLRAVGEYVYIAALGGGLRIISVADPAHPVEVGSYTPGCGANGTWVTLYCQDMGYSLRGRAAGSLPPGNA